MIVRYLDNITNEGVIRFLSMLRFSAFGIFIGSIIAGYHEYRTHPEIYIENSAPWYISNRILSALGWFVIVLVGCTVLIQLIRKMDVKSAE